MDLEIRKLSYTIKLAEGENVKVLVDDAQKFNDTILPGKIGKVSLIFHEFNE